MFSHRLSVHWLVPSFSSIPSGVNSSPCKKFWGVLVKCQYTIFYPFSGSEEQGNLLGNSHQEEGSSSFRQCPRSTFSDPCCWLSELSPSFPTLPAQLSGKHPRHHHLGMASLCSCSCCKPVGTQSRNQVQEGSGLRSAAESVGPVMSQNCAPLTVLCVLKYI